MPDTELQQLRDRVRDLEQRNQELEQFAYVASHDLLEPIRMVGSFVQLLDKEYGHTLTGEAALYLAHIRSGAERSRRMINDLLSFSRVGRTRELQCFPLHLAAHEALFNLADSIRERDALIELPNLPVVCVDRPMMIRLFQNLIGNAIKFRRDGTVPLIRVGFDDPGGEHYVFWVNDNGEGFEQKYATKIFGLFARLGTAKRGTGIGLSICEKIVGLHHGKIWAESTPGAGTTFFFTLEKPRES